MNALGYLLYLVGAIAALVGFIVLIFPCFGLSRKDGGLALVLSFALILLGPQLSPKLKAEINAQDAVSKAAAKTASDAPSEVRPLDRIRLSGVRWEKDGFGSIMNATFVINNDNPFAIKDVEVTCVHTSKTGTVIDRNTRTVYEMISARGYQSVVEMNMGFIHSAAKATHCKATDFTRLG